MRNSLAQRSLTLLVTESGASPREQRQHRRSLLRKRYLTRRLMAEHVWSVLCYSKSIDKETNVISLLHVIEKIELEEEELEAALAEKGPVVFPIQMELVSWWVRSDYAQPEMTTTFRLATVMPSGEEVYQPFSNINLEKRTGWRHIIRFSNFPFRGLGLYWLVLEKMVSQEPDAWQRVARIPVELVAAKSLDVVTEIKLGATSPELPSGPTPAAPPGSSSPPGPSHPSRRRASRAQRPRGSS